MFFSLALWLFSRSVVGIYTSPSITFYIAHTPIFCPRNDEAVGRSAAQGPELVDIYRVFWRSDRFRICHLHVCDTGLRVAPSVARASATQSWWFWMPIFSGRSSANQWGTSDTSEQVVGEPLMQFVQVRAAVSIRALRLGSSVRHRRNTRHWTLDCPHVEASRHSDATLSITWSSISTHVDSDSTEILYSPSHTMVRPDTSHHAACSRLHAVTTHYRYRRAYTN